MTQRAGDDLFLVFNSSWDGTLVKLKLLLKIYTVNPEIFVIKKFLLMVASTKIKTDKNFFNSEIPYNAKVSLWKTFADILATAKLFP